MTADRGRGGRPTEAAKPTLGKCGYVLMVITALFSTAGVTNAALYPATGMMQHLASVGQFPPLLGRSVGRREAPVGLLLLAAITLVFVVPCPQRAPSAHPSAEQPEPGAVLPQGRSRADQ